MVATIFWFQEETSEEVKYTNRKTKGLGFCAIYDTRGLCVFTGQTHRERGLKFSLFGLNPQRSINGLLGQEKLSRLDRKIGEFWKLFFSKTLLKCILWVFYLVLVTMDFEEEF